MSAIGAFSRTRTLKGKDVPMAMSKWWKKQRPAEAEITMHLSPYLLKPVAPWIKTFPKKVMDRVPVYLWPIGTVSLTYGIMVWADGAQHRDEFQHRY